MTMSYGYEKNKKGITLTKLYGKAAATVTIPAYWQKQKVTAVGESLFRGEKQLKKVILAEGIVTCDWWSFGECPNLQEVILPQSFRKIGNRAFSGCASLRRVVLPGNIEEIGEAAFWGCTSLRSIVLPPKLKEIKNRTFYGCSHLTNIRIPPAVERIEWGAFEYCTSLNRLAIPGGVKGVANNPLKKGGEVRDSDLPKPAAMISESLLGFCHLTPLKSGELPDVELRHWEENVRRVLALCYLAAPKRYQRREREMYEAYIRGHEREMVSLTIFLSELPALNSLYDMGLPAAGDIDTYIRQANVLARKEAVVSLLQYKENRCGRTRVRRRFAEEFSIEDEPKL